MKEGESKIVLAEDIYKLDLVVIQPKISPWFLKQIYRQTANFPQEMVRKVPGLL
jgi:chaperonin GroEL (HSP60 family)